MTISVTLSIVSCGKFKGNKRDAEIISEDDPWFESEVTKVDLGLDTTRMLDGYLIKMAGAD
jgi:hypothetical protein